MCVEISRQNMGWRRVGQNGMQTLGVEARSRRYVAIDDCDLYGVVLHSGRDILVRRVVWYIVDNKCEVVANCK